MNIDFEKVLNEIFERLSKPKDEERLSQIESTVELIHSFLSKLGFTK